MFAFKITFNNKGNKRKLFMENEKNDKLFVTAQKLYSLTAALCGYCENYDESIPEIAKLYEFSKILHNISRELFELL